MIKRITKNIFYLFIICCTALLLALPANAAGGSLQYFGINFSINGGDFVYNNLWWLPEDSSAKEYYLTIPHDAEEITANFGATGDVYLDGNKIQNGVAGRGDYVRWWCKIHESGRLSGGGGAGGDACLL